MKIGCADDELERHEYAAIGSGNPGCPLTAQAAVSSVPELRSGSV